MSLSADEFIRRFLMPVLPSGFQRIRYYGFLGSRNGKENLAECRRLLGMRLPLTPRAEADYRNHYEELTACSLRRCPQCEPGHMVLVAILPGVTGGCPTTIDSS